MILSAFPWETAMFEKYNNLKVKFGNDIFILGNNKLLLKHGKIFLVYVSHDSVIFICHIILY